MIHLFLGDKTVSTDDQNIERLARKFGFTEKTQPEVLEVPVEVVPEIVVEEEETPKKPGKRKSKTA